MLHLDHLLPQNVEAARANVKADRFNTQVGQIFLEGSVGDADLTLQREEGDVRCLLGLARPGRTVLLHAILFCSSALHVFLALDT